MLLTADRLRAHASNNTTVAFITEACFSTAWNTVAYHAEPGPWQPIQDSPRSSTTALHYWWRLSETRSQDQVKHHSEDEYRTCVERTLARV
jgi:hypothetical protein